MKRLRRAPGKRNRRRLANLMQDGERERQVSLDRRIGKGIEATGFGPFFLDNLGPQFRRAEAVGLTVAPLRGRKRYEG